MDERSPDGGDNGLLSDVEKSVKKKVGSDVKLSGVKRTPPQRKTRGGRRKRKVGVTTYKPASKEESVKKGAPMGVKLQLELRVVTSPK